MTPMERKQMEWAKELVSFINADLGECACDDCLRLNWSVLLDSLGVAGLSLYEDDLASRAWIASLKDASE